MSVFHNILEPFRNRTGSAEEDLWHLLFSLKGRDPQTGRVLVGDPHVFPMKDVTFHYGCGVIEIQPGGKCRSFYVDIRDVAWAEVKKVQMFEQVAFAESADCRPEAQDEVAAVPVVTPCPAAAAAVFREDSRGTLIVFPSSNPGRQDDALADACGFPSAH